MESIDNDGGCRRKVFQLAKYFKGKSGGWYPLASYHLKTILLHMNDQLKDWNEERMLVPRFTELIERLLKRVLHGVNQFLKTLRKNPNSLKP